MQADVTRNQWRIDIGRVIRNHEGRAFETLELLRADDTRSITKAQEEPAGGPKNAIQQVFHASYPEKNFAWPTVFPRRAATLEPMFICLCRTLDVAGDAILRWLTNEMLPEFKFCGISNNTAGGIEFTDEIKVARLFISTAPTAR